MKLRNFVLFQPFIMKILERQQHIFVQHWSRYPLQVLTRFAPASLHFIPGFPLLSGVDFQHQIFIEHL